MKFELPKTEDLRLTKFKFDFECSYANSTTTNTNYAKILKYCMKIALYCTPYDTLANDIGKILP